MEVEVNFPRCGALSNKSWLFCMIDSSTAVLLVFILV